MIIFLLSTCFIGLHECTSTVSLNPQSVNLALETSILFEPNDAKNNHVFIKNLQKMLSQIQNLVLPNPGPDLAMRTADTKNILTKFLIDLGIVLASHNDTDLKNISILFNRIVDDLYFKESLFHEIFIESRLKNFIRSVTKEWRDTNASALRSAIKKCLTHNSTVIGKFVRKLNKYYDEDDGKRMKKIVKRLRKYPIKKKDLTKVMTDGIKYLIFDHYNALNYSSKLKLATQLQKLTYYLTDNYKNKTLDPDLAVDFRRNTKLESGVSNLIETSSKVGNTLIKKKELVFDKNVHIYITGDSYILE